jgi:Copper type II ascorbate-dependent monooxygenase, N-terminal domain/DOMON domain/Copper type II ascorbate-dependent monooxygenase, C-terminal domain
MRLLWLFAACAFIGAAYGDSRTCDAGSLQPLPGLSFNKCVVLQAPGATAGPALRMAWKIVGDAVQFAMHTDAGLSTFGYVALGFSYNGGMRGAEMIIASVDPAGEFVLESRWSNEFVEPQPSGAPLQPLGYVSTANSSMWAFRRPVAAWSGDESNSIALLRSGGDHLIWAFGSSPGDFDYHLGAGFRGSVRLDLRLGAPADTILTGPDIHTLTVKTPTVWTDGTPSRYCWSWHPLPRDRKYHIVQVQALMQNRMPGLVHHIVSYSCGHDFEHDGSGGDVGARLRRGEVVCKPDGSMPPVCPANFIGWASSGVLTYPPEAGFPFGAGEATSILLEVHYENLVAVKGVPDESGFSFVYTTRLRPHDLGYLIVGDSLEQQAAMVQPRPQTLPAGHGRYAVTNLCPASCIANMEPKQSELHVVSTTFHMHVKGVAEYIDVYRDGRQRGRLAGTSHWDFEHQIAIAADSDVQLHPGDSLLTRCIYNTKNRSQLVRPYVFESAPSNAPVVGGFGTYSTAHGQFEEMCYAFLLVWPRVQRSTCIALKNVGFPSLIFCERNAQQRYDPANIMLDASANALTGKTALGE